MLTRLCHSSRRDIRKMLRTNHTVIGVTAEQTFDKRVSNVSTTIHAADWSIPVFASDWRGRVLCLEAGISGLHKTGGRSLIESPALPVHQCTLLTVQSVSVGTDTH
jgi:hypothetical protein